MAEGSGRWKARPRPASHGALREHGSFRQPAEMPRPRAGLPGFDWQTIYVRPLWNAATGRPGDF